MSKPISESKATVEELEYLIIENDSGARNPVSPISASILFLSAIFWVVFQLWVASPLPFYFNIGILNDSEVRYIHLSFAVFLAFLAYPAFKHSPRMTIGFFDWSYAIIGAGCSAYLFVFYEQLSLRAGIPKDIDIYISIIGVFLLLEATRRALGWPLVIIASILLLYTYFGDCECVPDLIRHKGQSLSKIASHIWLTTEGVFGIALGVSASFVFLFVLFGALLDKAGAGAYFIKLAFSLVGHMRGGPAKAAVIASGFTGLVSGSSIANVVTTGTFTIPLMRKVGFSGSRAGAIEVAASVNGQIMPPVMGAAAFLMVNYVNIPYFDVVKHAFLPAVISYIALLYMVHLEALKHDMPVIPKSKKSVWYITMLCYGIVISSIIILSFIVYHLIGWLRPLFGEHSSLFFSSLIVCIYLGLLYYSSRFPDPEVEDPDQPIITLPNFVETIRTGTQFILPLIVLIWFLMIEQKSPGKSAFYATMLTIFIILTQDFMKAVFRKEKHYKQAIKKGFSNLVDGCVTGARNMIGIGVATATAGIVVGVVSLTGVGLVLTEVIEAIAGNSIFLILLLTAIICLILGMGLPTTANYIIVAALMANVVHTLALKNGLDVPMIAIHLFVFYFGIMADVTPPVGLASFASAAISGADPIKTGFRAFIYSLRMAILPFLFIFNHEMIMIGVTSIFQGVWIFFYCTVAILIFSAGTQGYLLTKSKFTESILLIVASLLIFVPQQANNLFNPPYKQVSFKELEEIDISHSSEGRGLKIKGIGENIYGELEEFFIFPEINGEKTIKKAIENYGITYEVSGNKLRVIRVAFNSPAEAQSIDPFGNYALTKIYIPQHQPNKFLMYIPAVILFLFVLLSQFYRRRRETVLRQISQWSI